MADNNAKGHVDLLVYLIQRDYAEIWQGLNCVVIQFADIGLLSDAADNVVWRACQAAEVVMITNNRNAAGADSLESTIRSENFADTLPVITIADGDRFLVDREYAERAAERSLQFLLDIEKLRGTGRLYVP